MSWETTTLAVGTIGGLLLGYREHKRSLKVDATSAQAASISDTRAGAAQIIDGLNTLLDQKQEDYRELKVDLRDIRVAVEACATKLAKTEVERDEARRELQLLKGMK